MTHFSMLLLPGSIFLCLNIPLRPLQRGIEYSTPTYKGYQLEIIPEYEHLLKYAFLFILAEVQG